MLTTEAKRILRLYGNTVDDTLDAVIATPRDATREPHEFHVHFEESRTDGFAEAHVDGREVRHWVGC